MQSSLYGRGAKSTPQKPIACKYWVHSSAEGEFAHVGQCFASKPIVRQYWVQPPAGWVQRHAGGNKAFHLLLGKKYFLIQEKNLIVRIHCRGESPVLLLNGPFAIFQLNFFSRLGAVAIEAGKNFPHLGEIPFGKRFIGGDGSPENR